MVYILLFFMAFSFESKVVGVAADQVLTSRYVSAHVIFSALYQPEIDPISYEFPLSQSDLLSSTSNVLMECLVVEEAKAFDLAYVSESEVKTAVRRFTLNLAKSKLKKHWVELEMSEQEILDLARLKIRSGKLLADKMSSFTVAVSDLEINRHLQKQENNDQSQRAKAEAALKEEKLQSALQDWFQLLRTKYVVKNLLIGT